ncbi:MarR family winged helix-turn-helix transcriptional regulator [Pseudohongiella spirulinae]|uniref:Transcriptional regulator n=1 Tax=Pseudohongiella spirulinae TaxID=1249552 RepID=A0A0S2KB29_9GAMM|nr:MarR family transcriptional regulator [Pseudohongiella spirulinae]ALO45284.1 Transcriptional regulator [Pseudohongiella spirulinae]
MRKTAATLPEDFDPLALDNQICFPLYAASRLVTRLYQPFLEPLGLTYPQYIVLLILWENSPCTVGYIGKRAQLATNTLTPLLKRLELMDLVERRRSDSDERVVNIHLTRSGKALRKKCDCIPASLVSQVDYPIEEAIALKRQLDSFLAHLQRMTSD